MAAARSVTEAGLEEQLLALVVNKERAELEEARQGLVRQLNEFKIALKGLEDNLLVKLSNSQGEIRVQLHVTDDMMPGAVALCHGWGHQQVPGLSVASRTAGTNVNILARDGLDSLEPISGMSQLNGILVEVRADT